MVYFSKPLTEDDMMFEMYMEENPHYRYFVFSELDKDFSEFNSYVLDSLANCHVFCNPKLLTNIRNIKPEPVVGVKGIVSTLDRVGDHPIFGVCFYAPTNRVNVVSEGLARKRSGYFLSTAKPNTKKYLYNDDIRSLIVFDEDPRDGFHKCPISRMDEVILKAFPTICQKSYSSFVYSMSSYYTVEQQRRAQEAIQLHNALDHPSDKAMAEMLKSPSMINVPITAQDLANARAIYGPCPHCLEGKPHPHVGKHRSFDGESEPTKPGELLHVDIVYIAGDPYLFSVDHVSGYMNLFHMKSKSKASLQKGFEQLINFYRSNLKVVRMISSDHEVVIKSSEVYLNGLSVKLALRIPYEHEKTAERYVRMIREKMEAKLRELPYRLPRELHYRLAEDVIRNCNLVPNKNSSPLMPLEMVEDVKFNYNSDFNPPFGSAILVASKQSYQDGDPPKVTGIVLGPAKNTKGGIWVYVPGREEPLVRRGLKPMPMTEDIINYMNSWHAKEIDSHSKAHKYVNKGEEPEPEPVITFTETLVYSESGSGKSRTLDDVHVSPRKIYRDKTDEEIINEYIENEERDNLKTLKFAPSEPIVEKEVEAPKKSVPVHEMVKPNFPIESEIRRFHKEMNLPINTVETAEPEPDIDHETKSPAKKRVKFREPSKPINNNNNGNEEENLRRSSRSNKGVNENINAIDEIVSIPNRRKLHNARMNIWCIAAYLKDRVDSPKPMNIVYSSGQVQIQEALRSEFSKEAEEAALKELAQLIRLKSWKYIKNLSEATPSVHRNITPCSMFLKPKHDSTGAFLLWKARLVAGGHRTDPSAYDPIEKHSPTIPMEVAMMQLGIASYEKANVEVFDVPCAYLNAHLAPDKRQIMRFSKSISNLILKVDKDAKKYLQPDGTILVEVMRALYGFPESAKLWNDYMTATLKEGGYTQCPHEPCLFRKHRVINGKSEWSIVTVYVDDCLHVYKSDTGSTSRIRGELYAALRNANLPQPVVQELTLSNNISYLGINVQMKGPGKLFLSQPGYIKEILKQYKVQRGYITPCTQDIFKRPESELDGDPVDVTEYLSKLMKLMFLATRTRPDLLTTVTALATKCKSPNHHDMNRLDRVIGYVYTTKDMGIKLHVKDIKVYAYIDASWACHIDLKGHTGIVCTLGKMGFPIMFKSQKQKVVTRSSTEAELAAMFTGLDIVLYLRRLLKFFGYSQSESITIYQDNTSAIKMAYMGRGGSGSTSKYMDLKYFWIKDYLESKLFTLEYLNTNKHIADFFASPRIGQDFRGMRDIIMGYAQ